MEPSIDQHNYLDEHITNNAVLNWKDKKSAYMDKIKNEMIRHSINILLEGYNKLFNNFLQSGTFPDLWCEGLITPIFKSGDECDTNNYRWIRVTSCLGKCFCLILNQRLKYFTQDNNLIHPSQILSGHRTADHIFTLRSLIDKHVNQNKNGNVHACFVDLKKAFYSVWHDGLFLKLLNNKIGGKYCGLIKSPYSHSKCAVRCG